MSRLTPQNARDAKSAGGTIGLAVRRSWRTNAVSATAPAPSATTDVRRKPIAMIPPTTPKRPTVASAAPSQSTGGARRITGGSGTRRAATATVRSAGGITVANARRHEPASTNQPPSIGLTAPTSAVAADHVPMAAPRSARGNAPLRSARLFGTRSAPASPCAARAAMSQRASGATLPAIEASARPAAPAWNTRRRPKRSPSAPPARVSAARSTV